MLSAEKAYPTVAVKEMAAARKFYEGPLGLREVSTEGPGFVAYRTQDSMLFVYRLRFAGDNEATVSDVHVSGRSKVAWFKDPDGNIHSIAEE